MAPKNKGKGKAKAKERGSSSGQSSQSQEGQRASHTFDIVLDELNDTYKTTMESIPKALRELLIRLAPRKKRTGKTRLKRVHKKLYTVKEGSFMIRIKPSKNSPPEDHLTLLFRWSDLYYMAFHCKGVWYRLEDELKNTLPLPPASQLFYKKPKDGRVVDLPYMTTYDDLGGYAIHLGPKSFWDLYKTLMQTAQLKVEGRLDDLFELCQMSLPAVAFSEAARFGQFMEWVSAQTALGPNHNGDITPVEHSQYFRKWGSDSRELFDRRNGDSPEEICDRLTILKTPARVVEIPIVRGPHEKASASSEEDV